MTKESWIRKWKNCQRCPLHLNARHHVLYRGSIPAELLLIGEAPGKTEDKLGKPFIGRSGELLTVALQRLSVASYCITNVVCCIPLKPNPSLEFDQTREEQQIRPPFPHEAQACSPHIKELIELCQPKLVGLLGKAAEQSFDESLLKEGIELVILRHPAYILRRGGINSVEFKRFLVDFQKALENAGVSHFNFLNSVGA
jgi:uracil-DNA glycosylase